MSKVHPKNLLFYSIGLSLSYCYLLQRQYNSLTCVTCLICRVLVLALTNLEIIAMAVRDHNSSGEPNFLPKKYVYLSQNH